MKRKRLNDTGLPIKNRFEALATDPDTMEEAAADPPSILPANINENDGNTEIKMRKPYNLFFEVDANVPSFLAQIHKLSDKITSKYVRNQIKISTDCQDSFRRIQQFLVENKIPTRSLDFKARKASQIRTKRLTLLF